MAGSSPVTPSLEEPGALRIDFLDHGPAYDLRGALDRVPRQASVDQAVGGYGIHLAVRFTDGLVYDAGPHGNRLSLYKRLPAT